MGMAPVIRVVERLLAPLRRRVMLMIGRAVVRLVDDTPRRQRVQLEALSGELLDDVERWQQYGVTSHPPVGSEAVVLALGGMRQHAAAVVVEDAGARTHPAAQVGETRLYTIADGDAPSGARHRVVLSPEPSRGIVLVSRASADVNDVALVSLWSRGGAAAQPVVRMRAGRSQIRISDSQILIRSPRVRFEQVE